MLRDLHGLGTQLRTFLPAFALLLFFILWLGLRGEDPEPWHITLVCTGFAFCAWIWHYRRYRHYADTPEAPIASAPQGYIAIRGIGRALPGTPLLSPFNYLPCLWYRMRVEIRKHNDEWEEECDETSDASFILEGPDGARCTVDPAGASVETLHKDRVTIDDRRTTQWLLIPGTRLHAMGYFESRRPIEDRDSAEAELREKLADWKSEGRALRHFDEDGNGELDLNEWEHVRTAAREEVLNEREAAADFPAYHCLRAPQDGRRPFVISDRPPEQVRRNYHRQAWIWFALALIGLSVSAWLATQT